MKCPLVILAAAGVASAFSGMAGIHSRHESLHMLKERAEAEALGKRQDTALGDLNVGGIVGGLVDTVTGLLGFVAASVDPDNKRPEPGYTFKAPRKGDSRGPCPGLNLLCAHTRSLRLSRHLLTNNSELRLPPT